MKNFAAFRSMSGKAFNIRLAALVTSAIVLAGCSQKKEDGTARGTASSTAPIQVGWMTSWATTGQIMQALIHTNIGQLYGVPLVFRNFLFGPDINEAALHGEVDCVNNGLVPTISLLAASPDWVIVGRLIDSPLSIVARDGSGIKIVPDLKGHSIAVPFGGGTHPYVLQRLEQAGLQIGEGREKVKLVNLKPSEQAIALQQGSVDAVGTWEPQTAIILLRGGSKVIAVERHLGVITVRKSLAEKEPEKIVRLLKAYIEANFYVAKHKKETDEWYAQAAHFDNSLISSIGVIEPNVKAQTVKDIAIDLAPADLALGQRFADTMLKAQLIPHAIDFKARADGSYLQRALDELAKDGFETAKITVATDK